MARYFIAASRSERTGSFRAISAWDWSRHRSTKSARRWSIALLLFCYRYDPETGKYTMTALNLVRRARALTVVVLARRRLLVLAWRLSDKPETQR